MYVYRVEHPNKGLGPYQCNLTQDKDHLYEYPEHPSPWCEGLEIEEHEVCGFESKEKLLKWFTLKDLKDFRKEGLRVYKMHVVPNTVQIGERQVVFDREEVYYKKEVSLKSLRVLH
jgi:hypothetical protein